MLTNILNDIDKKEHVFKWKSERFYVPWFWEITNVNPSQRLIKMES